MLVASLWLFIFRLTNMVSELGPEATLPSWTRVPWNQVRCPNEPFLCSPRPWTTHFPKLWILSGSLLFGWGQCLSLRPEGKITSVRHCHGDKCPSACVVLPQELATIWGIFLRMGFFHACKKLPGVEQLTGIFSPWWVGMNFCCMFFSLSLSVLFVIRKRFQREQHRHKFYKPVVWSGPCELTDFADLTRPASI